MATPKMKPTMKTICIILGLLAVSCMANAANQTKSSPDKPVRLYVESYTYSEHAEVHPSGQGYNSDGTQTYSFKSDNDYTWKTDWTDDQGGTASYHYIRGGYTTGSLGENSGTSTRDDDYEWPASKWPDMVAGTVAIDWTVTDNNGVTTPNFWTGVAAPLTVANPGNEGGWLGIGYEHCQEMGFAVGTGTYNDTSGNSREAQDMVVYSRKAETVMKLYTGGKALSKRQNLFMLNATARSTQGMKLRPNLLGDLTYWEWDLPPLWGPTVDVDSTEIEMDGMALDVDGKQWRIYKDDDTRDVTPKVKNTDYYTFSVGQQKYKSSFEVFVRQPYPNYPDDAAWYGPYGPPLGWPVYNIGASDAGHAWWKISTEAPIDIVNRYTTTNCSRWMNVEAGYGPLDDAAALDWWRLFLLQGIAKQGPGKVYGGSTGATVHRTYGVGFQGKGVIDGVNYVEGLSVGPGTWDSQYHNCVHETVITGKTTGVQLPLSDVSPEGFGFKLPPDSN